VQQKHSNQHIKRKEVAESAEFIRKRIQAGILIKRLKRASSGKLEMSKSQLEATKMLLDKAMPSLQAVEHSQTEVPKTEDEILASLAHLIASNPAVLKPLVDADPGVRAALQSILTGAPSVVDAPQTAPRDDQQVA
jgi:hypothetical protein